jgi:hypothetical protein
MEKLLEKAHRIYESEASYLRTLMAKDPTYSSLLGQLEGLEAKLAHKLDAKTAAALTEARELLLEMTRETAFKMGYVHAHTHELDEVSGPDE